MTSSASKTAVDPAVLWTPSLFYDSARAGLLDLLVHHAHSRPGLSVLLPSFIGWSPNEGSGLLDPVKDANLSPTFYGLHADLSVNLEHLSACLDSVEHAVVLLIHYYGRTQPRLEDAAALARSRGAVVVEDLAHGFFSAQGSGPAGRVGDVLMFSLHKMFPTPQALGGMVTYRNSGLLTGQLATRPDLAGYLLDYDWRAIAVARRRNFLLISAGLQKLLDVRCGFELLWPDLGHDVPQTLPIRITEGRRDDVYHRMNADGFGMVSLYHTLVPELTNDMPMAELARSIINFPVHQDLDPRVVGPMLQSFESALNGSSEAGKP